jgi:hypothetical protein
MKWSSSNWRSVRVVCLVLAVISALAVCGTSAAATGPQTPSEICAYCGDSGSGWTGCTTQTEDHSASIPLIASVRHYLVVSYCKQGGIITSLSIAAHGCDVGGIVGCSVGPAWQTEGGVGTGFATFEAHATWVVQLPPFYNNHDTLNLSIPVG